MTKRLFFICPTDFLETRINNNFKGDNYFVTSLGNSIGLDANQVDQISTLIITKDIKEVNFILSDNNRIIQDANGKQKFSYISGLDKFYDEITSEKIYSTHLWKKKTFNNTILSSHLVNRSKDLQLKLENWHIHYLRIKILIFNSKTQDFNHIRYNLLDFQINLN